MRPSDVMAFINEMETRFPVDQWQADGVHLWPIARFRLAIEIDAQFVMQTDQPVAGPDTDALAIELVKSNLRFLKSWWLDRKHNASYPKQTDVLFLVGGITYADIEGKYYEKFCDPMQEHLTEKGLTSFFLTAQNRGHIPRYTPSKFIQPYLDAAKFPWLFKSFFSTIDRDKCLPGHREFEQAIEKKLRFKTRCLHRIELKGKLIREYSKFFLKILKKLKPKLAAVVCYYNMEGYALNLACNQLNIPGMDLQHGFQGPLHSAYGRFVKAPSEGFNTFPKYFWCWGPREAATIRDWTSKTGANNESLEGANLFLELWRSGKGVFVSDYDKKIQSTLSDKPPLKNILITLQTPKANESFWHFVDTVIKKSTDRYRWWIRSHPGWLSEGEKIKKLYSKQPHLEFDLATELPLYALLRHMDLHLTYGSSTIIEAEEFGVPSVMLTDTQKEYFLDAFDSGIVVSAKNAEELGQAIELQLEKKKPLKTVQEESIKNLNRALELLYNKAR